MSDLSVFDIARNSLTHLASRYVGESGVTVRDHAILAKCVQNIVDALDAGEAKPHEVEPPSE